MRLKDIRKDLIKIGLTPVQAEMVLAHLINAGIITFDLDMRVVLAK